MTTTQLTATRDHILDNIKKKIIRKCGISTLVGNPAAIMHMVVNVLKFLFILEKFDSYDVGYSFRKSTLSKKGNDSQYLRIRISFEEDQAPVASFYLTFEVNCEGEDENPSYSFTVEAHSEDNDAGVLETFSCEFGWEWINVLMIQKLETAIKNMYDPKSVVANSKNQELKQQLERIAKDEDLIEVARQAIEDELLVYRNERISCIRRNGLVIRESNGEESSIIRFGPEVAVKIALQAIAKKLS